MLNRRQVRVRAMQCLYAFGKSKGANLLLAKDQIAEQFQPDLNSMIPQDRHKLEGLRKLAIEGFEEVVFEKNTDDDYDYPDKVKKAITEAAQTYQLNNRNDFANIKAKTSIEAEKVYELYINLLSLFLDLADIEETDAKKKASGLYKNKILKELRNDQVFENQNLRTPSVWKNEDNFVRKVYKEVLASNERYQVYTKKVNHPAEEDLAILKYLTKNVFLKNSEIIKVWENYNIYFSEDKETLRSMVAHTFQPYLDQGKVQLREKGEDWSDKKDFMMTLIEESQDMEKVLLSYILPKLKNWDFERIAETDKILLKIALVEMIHFPSIPIKVTINEIIEIAKSYSTPRSSQFINGILDVLSKELSKKEVIKKSGRGMLDNK